jgi:hypothetical protein
MGGILSFIGSLFEATFELFKGQPKYAFYLFSIILVIIGAIIPSEKIEQGKNIDQTGTKYGIIGTGIAIFLMTLIFNEYEAIKQFFRKLMNKQETFYYF